MSQLINEILEEMKLEHGISKFELEKIVDSQFKVLMNHIQDYKTGDIREVHIKGLGKFRPTTFLKKLNNNEIPKKSNRDNNRNI